MTTHTNLAMRTTITVCILIAALTLLSPGCALFKPGGPEPFRGGQPRAEREFRAAWVATVANIDWPSKPGLSTEEQQKEAITILDTLVALHMNAVVLQVRPHCDAMYASKLEPWSYYLTGMQGRPPDPFYDPLAFWVQEAHKRGIELHAWFNPYRAHLEREGPLSDSSIVRKHPELAKKLNDGTYWLDPAKKEVQDHSFNVVMDVVRRYDIDGVHFDDYFYPYGDGNFPDDDTWDAYVKSGGSLSREDWRRAAVNTFIERVYDGIKREKPYVKFGLSPFGIWRPGYPPSIEGFDQYKILYADARLWLHKGWVDYWSPQLYWPINQIPQSFPVLLGWWSRENTMGRNLWPGMIIGRMTDEKGADEIVNEIMIERGFVPDAPGHIHFSMKVFLKDTTALNAALENGPYKKMALVPPSPWLGDTPPAQPRATVVAANDSTEMVSWSHPAPGNVFHWVVYYQYGNAWEYTILNNQDRFMGLPLSRTVPNRGRRGPRAENVPPRIEHLTKIAVSAVDRLGNESEIVQHVLPVPAAPTAQ